jgi:alkylated DNA repair dioxygenase AlkB
VQTEPEGLVYHPAFVTEDEERALITLFDATDFHAVEMHGRLARRTVRHYGYDYAYDARRAAPGEPLPAELEWLRDRCAALIEREPPELAEALVTRYPPGAGIGWHRDAPMFGPEVIGVSLGSACPMRFERRLKDVRYVYELELARRSVYVLAGKARSAWRHSIPAAPALRYSVTFRTLKTPG